MQLYWSWFINPQKVRFALEELELPHRIHELQLLRGEQRHESFLALNPNGKVPVLQTDEFVLWESNAILAYLGETTQRLWPQTAASRADALRWMFFESCHLQAPIGVFWFSDFVAQRKSLSAADRATAVQLRARTFPLSRRDEANATLRQFLPVLDRHLSRREWMLGNAFTLVDCCYGPQLDGLKVSEWPLADYPAIDAYLSRVRSRVSWQHCQAADSEFVEPTEAGSASH